jgi:hypothetical protein
MSATSLVADATQEAQSTPEILQRIFDECIIADALTHPPLIAEG